MVAILLYSRNWNLVRLSAFPTSLDAHYGWNNESDFSEQSDLSVITFSFCLTVNYFYSELKHSTQTVTYEPTYINSTCMAVIFRFLTCECYRRYKPIAFEMHPHHENKCM